MHLIKYSTIWLFEVHSSISLKHIPSNKYVHYWYPAGRLEELFLSSNVCCSCDENLYIVVKIRYCILQLHHGLYPEVTFHDEVCTDRRKLLLDLLLLNLLVNMPSRESPILKNQFGELWEEEVNKNQFPFCKWRIYLQHTTSGYNPYEPDMVSHCPLWWPHPSTATLHQRGWHEMDTQTRLHLSKWCGRFTCDVNRKCFICNKVVIVQFQGLSVTDSVSMQCLDYLLTFVTLPSSTLCIFNCLAHPYGCPQ